MFLLSGIWIWVLCLTMRLLTLMQAGIQGTPWDLESFWVLNSGGVCEPISVPGFWMRRTCDIGGSRGRHWHAPPNRIQFFRFHTCFCQKAYMSEVGAPPAHRVGTPQWEILDLPLRMLANAYTESSCAALPQGCSIIYLSVNFLF